MDTKFCRICGEIKNVGEFREADLMRDGHRNECKKCSCKIYYNKERKRELNLEKIIINNGEKKCRMCGELKDINEFHLKRGTPDGHRHECKECVKIIQKKYTEQDGFKEKQIEYDKKRYEKLQDETIQRMKRYRIDNREEVNKKANEKRKTQHTIDLRKKWFDKNKDVMAKHQKKYRDKYPHVIAWRTILHSSLNRLETKKENHTIDMLGYSSLDLKEHIEKQFTKGMSWENYGDWNIDHHFPVTSFPIGTDVKIVCALSNLKPMWATTRVIDGILYEGNLNKGNKIPTI